MLTVRPSNKYLCPWGAKSAREQFNASDGTANFGLLRDPSFLAPRMRLSLYVAVFE